MNRKQLERRLPKLLHDTAEQVSPDVDLRQRIAARLLAQTRPRYALPPSPVASNVRQPWHVRLRRQPELVGAALVAVLLLVSAFAVARPLVLSWFGDKSLQQIALQDGTPINKAVTVQGVTLTLQDGYADAARTVLTMHISSADTTHFYSLSGGRSPSGVEDISLEDAQGNEYTAFAGNQFNSDALWEFVPLHSDELGVPQSLTLVVNAMQQSTGNPTNPETTLSGPWQINFQLTPQAGHPIQLGVAPQTHGGITLLPERLDLTPAGVRLLVRESGLPPDTSIFSVKHFATRQDDIVACPPGQHVCGESFGTGDGAKMQISAPNGQTLVPGWVNVVSPVPAEGVPIGRQALGPAGTAEIEFLFFSPITATQGTAHVTFNEVRYASATDSSAPEQIVPGPWSFTLPLS